MPQALIVPWQDEMYAIDVLLPNVRGRHVVPRAFDVTFTTDSQRFRGRRDYPSEPAHGTVRIAVLGDSNAFGIGANDDETYPARLERILQERFGGSDSHRPVEVINAGIPGSGTAVQALYYAVWVKQFHPDVVLLTAFVDDADRSLSSDVFRVEDGKAVLRPLSERRRTSDTLHMIRSTLKKFPPYELVAQHSEFLGLLRNTASVFIEHGLHRASMTTQVDASERLQREGLVLEVAEIRWLSERAREAGARLVIVIVPARELIYPSHTTRADDVLRKSPAFVEALRRVCTQLGIPFADIIPQIRARAEASSEPLFYGGLDIHPTPAGYKAFAETIAAFLIGIQAIRP